MDRNLILAIVLSAAVLLIWELFVGAPQREALEAARQAQEAEQAAQEAVDPTQNLARKAGFGAPENGPASLSLDDAIAAAPGRIEIETPSLSGSINLKSGRFDDLVLKKYRETLDEDSDNIHLLQPAQVEHGHYVEQGWLTSDGPTSGALWQATQGTKLTPQTPVTLTRTKGGLTFEKTISVDENYLFTVTQTVRNTSGNAVSLTPYAVVIQQGIPEELKGGAILHEGAVGIIGKKLYDKKYKKLAEGGRKGTVEASGTGGWVGITNKYWLAAAIPPQEESFDASYENDSKDADNPVFRTSYLLNPRIVEPDSEVSVTSYVFGGAKDVGILQSYEKPVAKGGLGITDFDKAVDWGWLNFLTRPIFYTLSFFGDLTGNFGVAILILTLIIKAILFPLANKGYESMTRMKKVQPKLEKIRERYADDKMKLQQEMMALYKKENVNPMAGCLPILIQMPIFFALYKTLFVTLELRHEPFIGWIKDLSAPDPTNIFNLFGLIPFDPTTLPLIGAFLGVGILPILMGVGMWFQMSLNPPPPDPTQRQIFAMMPFIFVFLFGSFAAGLVIYWVWNTILSIAQQILIMKKNGVEVEWRERFSFLFPKDKTVTVSASTDDTPSDKK